MLSVLTGSFRSLEEALTDRLRTRPPLEPACVVVPSGHVARRVKRALASAGGAAAVSVLNFHELARRLAAESGVPVRAAVEDLGEEEIFRAFLREPGSPERYRELADRPGAGTLLATVLDLRAAMVESPLLRDVKEELPEDAQRLAELATLLDRYGEFLAKSGLGTRADVTKAAIEAVERSRLVLETPNWAVYGFYEFLGEQKDLLDMLAHAAEVTLYVPYRPAPAWKYAKRLLDSDLGGSKPRPASPGDLFSGSPGVQALKSKPPRAAGTNVKKHAAETRVARATSFTQKLFDPAAQVRVGDPEVPLKTVAGTGDEMWFAVKEARRVHDVESVAWRDIAIVARSLRGRTGAAARWFTQEAVPWQTTATHPLGERPLAQAATLALRIALDGAYHADVLEWLSSPLVKCESRPETFRAITAALGIVDGEDWKRLEEARGGPLVDGEDRELASAADVKSFADAVSALRTSVSRATGERTWAAGAAAWEKFFAASLDTGQDEAAWRSIEDSLRALAALDRACPPPRPYDVAASLRRSLAAKSLPVQSVPADGVALLDAMTARAHRFRVAILLGLNEGEWPRVPREDPFLPDASRRRISETTGARLREKMAASEEERLLFALSMDCADRIVIVRRRTNDDGWREEPSAFLEELRRVVPVRERKVPRLPVKKYEWMAERLAPLERRLHAILTGTIDPDPAVVKARALETPSEWTPFDVLSAPPAATIERLSKRGFSPSGFETLATCPFKYWASNVAGLRLLDPLEAEEDPGPPEIGKVLHAALAQAGEGDPVAAARELFKESEARRPPPRWAVWEAARDAALAALAKLAKHDRAEREAGGWEILKSEFEANFLAGPDPVPGFHGRVDRVDRREVKGVAEFRVTDFKYRLAASTYFGSVKPETAQKKALADLDRGLRVQLAVYARLVGATVCRGARFAGSHYYFFGPRLDPVRLGLDDGDGAEALAAAAGRAWDVLGQGAFVIVDDREECRRCDLRGICRRGHYMTRTRAIADPRLAAFIAKRAPK